MHHDDRTRFFDTRDKNIEVDLIKKLRSSSIMDESFKWKPAASFAINQLTVETVPLFKLELYHFKISSITNVKVGGREVLGRLSNCNDLVAEEAVYHIPCLNKFRLNLLTGNKMGCLADDFMLLNFNKVCDWLEKDADCDLCTLKEVHDKMLEFTKDSPCYSIKYLKNKLVEYYGEHIYFFQKHQVDQMLFSSKTWLGSLWVILRKRTNI